MSAVRASRRGPAGSRAAARQGLCRCARSAARLGRELLRKEQFALGATIDALCNAAGRPATEYPGQLAPLVVQVQRWEVQPLDVRQPLQLGQLDQQRMAATLQVIRPRT